MSRRALLAFTLAAGCGSSSAKHDASAVDDGPPSIDAAPCVATPPPPPACAPVSGTNVRFAPVYETNGAALLVTAPINDPRLFIVERGGAVRVVVDGVLLPEAFIDLSEILVAGGEQGLLGLAFHPGYACNGAFYVYYTTGNANVVAKCTVSSSSPNLANPTCDTVLSVPDFAGNHNGGMMEFGPDGYLYIGTGDGGGGGDPQRSAQDPDNLLGKILRIDVDNPAGGELYGIPADNPYASGGGAPEVFIRGLRNPWRWSFDKQTGDLWIGDVGQGRTEELTVLRAGEQLGRNLGWSIYEGNACCDTQDDDCRQSGTQYACDPMGLTFPQDVHSHSSGWISIIAGEVYRGTCYPDLVGWHFYTDHASTNAGLWKARLMADNSLEVVELSTPMPAGVASLHADARGELYLTTIGGDVYHLEAGP